MISNTLGKIIIGLPCERWCNECTLVPTMNELRKNDTKYTDWALKMTWIGKPRRKLFRSCIPKTTFFARSVPRWNWSYMYSRWFVSKRWLYSSGSGVVDRIRNDPRQTQKHQYNFQWYLTVICMPVMHIWIYDCFECFQQYWQQFRVPVSMKW